MIYNLRHCFRLADLEQGETSRSAHDYTDHELEPWAEYLRRCARQGLKGFVYFNNDVNTRAPLNALRLAEMVGKYAQRAPNRTTDDNNK